MANDKSKIEIGFEATGVKEVEKVFDSITNTAGVAHKKLFTLQAAYTKKAVDGFNKVDEAVKKIDLKTLSKDLSHVAFGTEEGAKAMRKLEKSQQATIKHSKVLAELNDGRKWGKAHEEAANGLAKERKIQGDIISDLKEKTDDIHKSQAALNQLVGTTEKHHDLLEKNADLDRGGLALASKHITAEKRELDVLKKEHHEISKIADEEQRRGASKQFQEKIAAKFESAQSGVTTQTAKGTRAESLSKSRGMADKFGLDSPVSGIADKLKGFSEALGVAGKEGSMLGGAFETVVTIIEGLEMALGGWLIALIAVGLAADKVAADMNKRLTKGLGAASMSTHDVNEIGDRSAGLGAKNALTGLRATNEEIQDITNTLMQSGMSIKNLGGDYDKLTKATEISMNAARSFGVTMEEGGKIVGDYYAAYGAGTEEIQQTMAIMTRDIKNSSMTANNFLSIMQSVSAQFNIFVDQTKTFSGLLATLGKNGEFSAKQMAHMMDALSPLSKQGIQQNISNMAVAGGAFKKQAKSVREKAESDLKTEQNPVKRQELANMIDKMTTVEKGGTRAAATALDSMPMLNKAAAIFGNRNAEEMTKLQRNPDQLAIMGAKHGLSEDQIQDMAKMFASTLAQKGPQARVGDLSKYEAASAEEINQQTEANKAMAQKTTAVLAGSLELANSFLAKIATNTSKLGEVFTVPGEIKKLKEGAASGAGIDKNSPGGDSVSKMLLKDAAQQRYKNDPAAQEKYQQDMAFKPSTATAATTTKPGDFSSVFPQGPGMGVQGTAVKPSTDTGDGFFGKLGKMGDMLGGSTPNPRPTPGGGVNLAASVAGKDSDAIGTDGTAPINIKAWFSLANNNAVEAVVKKVVRDYETKKQGQ